MNKVLFRIIYLLSFAAGAVYYVHSQSDSNPLVLGAAILSWILFAAYLLWRYRKELTEKEVER